MSPTLWSFGLLAAALAAAPAASACSKANGAPAVAMRVTQPLVASPDGDNSTEVEVRRDGCVIVHYPAFDTRAGTYEFLLPAGERDALLREVAATGVSKLDAAALRRDLKQRDTAKRASSKGPRWVTSDEEVIEIAFDAGAKSLASGPALRWSGLRGQLMNHPDHPQLIGLAALRDRLLELGNDQRKRKVQP